MLFKLAILSSIVAILSGNVMANFIVGSFPMDHDQALTFCAQQGSRLADIDRANQNALVASLNGKQGWVGSWDGNSYPGSCIYGFHYHVGLNECGKAYYPVCNPVLFRQDSSSYLQKSFNAANDHSAYCAPVEVPFQYI